VRRPSKSSKAIARFAARIRELEGLEPREPFFVRFGWGLVFEGIDTSAWNGDPNILGWIVTAEDSLEPVSRQEGRPREVHFLSGGMIWPRGCRPRRVDRKSPAHS
jgi:hypothetical protein